MDPLRQKARFGKDGSYVTKKQLKFINLCKKYPSNTQKVLIKSNKTDFEFYIDWVKQYNIAYDLSELDSKAASIYWDEESNQLSFCINSEYLIEQNKLNNNLLEKIGITDDDDDSEIWN